MIEFIEGKIDDISSKYIVVENHGIGYQINCANPFTYQPLLGERTKIYTYQHVKEDILALYGFKTRSERALFVQLLSVSGIGPKGALAVLASGQPDVVIRAIESENETYLTKFPGVGKKTARQIILDLKGKFKDQGMFDIDPAGEQPPATDQALDEAMEALSALGYSEKEIKRITPKLVNKQYTSEQYVKEALRLMLKE